MKVSELNDILQSKKVPEHWYAINGLKEDAVCIVKSGIFHQNWEVFYVERGKKYEVFVTSTENEACEYFLERIIDTWERYKKRKETQND